MRKACEENTTENNYLLIHIPPLVLVNKDW